MYYCSLKHMRLHRERLGHDAEECGRMATQAARRQVRAAGRTTRLHFVALPCMMHR